MNDEKTWAAVEDYLVKTLVQPDEAQRAALAASEAAGLPAINVTANHGKLLMMLVRAVRGGRPGKVLEIGTLGGFSTMWMARGLGGGGKVITLEMDPRHAALARKNIARAGLADAVEVREGVALETLPGIAAEAAQDGPFDLVFIDADKVNIPAYFEWSLKMVRVGSLIVVDNVVREGAVIDANSRDESVRGVRRFNDMVAAERRVTATAIQTVGSKGYDGFAVVEVVGD